MTKLRFSFVGGNDESIISAQSRAMDELLNRHYHPKDINSLVDHESSHMLRVPQGQKGELVFDTKTHQGYVEFPDGHGLSNEQVRNIINGPEDDNCQMGLSDGDKGLLKRFCGTERE